MRKFLVFFILCFPFFLKAQILDDFNDGNYTSNPNWLGDSAYFFVNANNQLQSKFFNGSSQTFLATKNSDLFNTVWTFLVEMNFSPSSSNQFKIFLNSNTPKLTDSTTAYYIQIGEDGNLDSYDLYKIINNKKTKLIDGIAGHASKSTIFVQLKIQRDNLGNWKLFSDTLLNNAFSLEGECFDNSILSGSYFFINPTFTSSRSDKFYFDDLKISSLNSNENPAFQEYEFLSSKKIKLNFNLPLSNKSFISNSFFYVDKSVKINISANVNSLDPSQLILSSKSNFPSDTIFKIYFDTLLFQSGKMLVDTFLNFKYISELNKLFINEIFPDPSPIVDLPEYEFIELYNHSADTLSLKNLYLQDLSTKCFFGDEKIRPFEYLILTDNSNDSSFEKYGRVFHLSNFPSLNNSADLLAIRNLENELIDSISYTSKWYRDASKSSGGFTLERIFPSCNCRNENNWIASYDAKGGTPGRVNSINNFSELFQEVLLNNVEVLNPLSIKINFSSAFKLDNKNYHVRIPPFLNSDFSIQDSSDKKFLIIFFKDSIPLNIVYNGAISGIVNCGNNFIDPLNFSFVRLKPIEKESILINEVLFDPYVNSSDFVELFNNSQNILNLKELYISNSWPFDKTNAKQIFLDNFYLKPSEYIVITDNKEDIEKNYFCLQNTKFAVIKIMPSFNNDKGKIFISRDTLLLDSFYYYDSMHSSLLNNVEGVSLERVSNNRPTMEFNNWRSASALKNYASPGQKNSQEETLKNNSSELFFIDRPYVSPDNDGFEDYLNIQFNLKEKEALADVDVLDLDGNLVRKLISSTYIKNEGIFVWDGLNMNKNICPNGIYLIQLKLFFPDGEYLLKREGVVVFMNN